VLRVPAHRPPRVLAIVACLTSLTSLAPEAGAQRRPDPPYGVFEAERSVGRDVRLMAANAAIGGATVGVRQWMRGRPVWPAVRGGLAGGALAYAGKRMAVERWRGAGFAGREVAAVGHSIVRNASEERPLLSRLMLPIGPLNLYVRPDSRTWLRARIDAPSVVAALLLGVTGNQLDGRASLSAGALVFRMRTVPMRDVAGDCVPGATFGSVIALSDVDGLATDSRNPIWAHERVHVLQYDQLFTTMGDPVEQWIARRSEGFGRFKRWADFNLSGVVALAPTVMFEDYTPWEQEARTVTQQTLGDAPVPGLAVLSRMCAGSEYVGINTLGARRGRGIDAR
jgi:hypothetical protein